MAHALAAPAASYIASESTLARCTPQLAPYLCHGQAHVGIAPPSLCAPSLCRRPQVRADEAEGADIMMVKPGMPYLDMVRCEHMQSRCLDAGMPYLDVVRCVHMQSRCLNAQLQSLVV